MDMLNLETLQTINNYIISDVSKDFVSYMSENNTIPDEDTFLIWCSKAFNSFIKEHKDINLYTQILENNVFITNWKHLYMDMCY